MRLEDIKQIRRKIGITQTELSSLSGISQSAIAKIEAGTMNPAYDSAQKLFEALENFERKSSFTAKDVLTKKVYIVDASETVEKAVSLMKKHNISQLPVFEQEHLVGLISENILVEHLGDENLGEEKVRKIMNESPPTISEDAPLKLIKDMLKYVPIVLVYKRNKLIGLIAKSDLLKTVG